MKENYIVKGHYFDFAIAIVLMIFIHFYYPKYPFPLNEKNQDVLLSILSSNISLIGFGAAALTIIITFRANYLSKNAGKKPSNFLEFLVLGKSYFKISKIFKSILIEFVISYAVLYSCFLLPFIYLHPIRILYLIIFGIVCLVSPCIRILYTLFNLLDMENKPFEDDGS
jgi:hypothetical protein